jgi:hypothetical protein
MTKAIMCRDLRRNVFFHREMENASVTVLDRLPGNPTSQAFQARRSEQDENSNPGGTA